MKAFLPVFLVLALTIGGVALLFLLDPDEEPVDDRDLIPHASKIPDSEENPSLRLAKLLAEMPELTSDESETMRLASSDRNGQQWTDLAELVRQRSQYLDAVREACKEEGWKNKVVYDVAATFPELSEFRLMARIIKLRGELLLHEGKPAEAADEAVILMRFSKRMEEAGGTLIHGLVALSIHRMGQDLLINTLQNGSLNSSDLRRWREEQARYRLDPAKFADFFRAEYQFGKKLLTDIRDGKMDPAKMAQPGEAVLVKAISPFFQYNRSVNSYAAALRLAIHDLKSASGERLFEKEVEAKIHEKRAHWYRMLFSSNALGEILQAFSLPGLSGTIKAHAHALAVDALIEIDLAAREFQQTEKRALASLDELVPRYLPAIPLDPFDGQPMRFNPETRRVYSIGADLIDAEGDFSQNPGNQPLHHIKEEPALELPAFP